MGAPAEPSALSRRLVLGGVAVGVVIVVLMFFFAFGLGGYGEVLKELCLECRGCR
jgi:hypothetical protein